MGKGGCQMAKGRLSPQMVWIKEAMFLIEGAGVGQDSAKALHPNAKSNPHCPPLAPKVWSFQ